MRRMPRRSQLILAVAAVATLFLLVTPAAFAGVFSPQNEGSPNAQSISTLYRLIMVLAIIVFVLVEGALFYSIFKYRARRGAVAAQIHGNTRLEIGWTVAAALILVLITTVTFIKLDAIKTPARSGLDANGNPVSNVQFATTDQPAPPKGGEVLTLKVDGQQYVWRFQYPGPKPVFSYEEMVVPKDVTVVLDITADDVAHSWWIPALGGKMDALPGYVNHTWFKATKTGTYTGQCAELCGRNHANMYARVRVVEFPEYRAWYDRQAADIQTARKLGAQQRAAIERQQGEQATQGTGGGSTGPTNP